MRARRPASKPFFLSLFYRETSVVVRRAERGEEVGSTLAPQGVRTGMGARGGRGGEGGSVFKVWLRACEVCVCEVESRMTRRGDGGVMPPNLGLARDHCAGICSRFYSLLLYLSLR